MKRSDDSLSIILPVFNEGKNIEGVINEIFRQIPQYIEEFEVILVNDGSIDNTQAVVNGIKEHFFNLKVISHGKNKGYGAAIRSGIQAAVNYWVLIMDADGQFRISDLKGIWEARDGNDFILGFRRRREDNLYRSFMGRSGNTAASLLLKRRIFDINCGFKLFKKKDLQGLKLNSTGGIISFEILYKLLNSGKKKFRQMPVNHYKRGHGRQTGGAVKTITRIIYEGAKVVINKRDY